MSTEQPMATVGDDQFVYQTATERPPSEAVVAAIAAQTDDAPIAIAGEYGPLYEVVDPGALDALFDSSGGPDRSEGTVTFTYANRRVEVDTTGRVVLRPLEQEQV
ncbi:HalOD1 output domain-containing protein [Natronobacterium texcoconense]|nr:HalOD1 output domain-containing protein [Natronobacterium texcoconense]